MEPPSLTRNPRGPFGVMAVEGILDQFCISRRPYGRLRKFGTRRWPYFRRDGACPVSPSEIRRGKPSRRRSRKVRVGTAALGRPSRAQLGLRDARRSGSECQWYPFQKKYAVIAKPTTMTKPRIQAG